MTKADRLRAIAGELVLDESHARLVEALRQIADECDRGLPLSGAVLAVADGELYFGGPVSYSASFTEAGGEWLDLTGVPAHTVIEALRRRFPGRSR